jgi:pimeloyl-ACP methyl ester carboxylesterase
MLLAICLLIAVLATVAAAITIGLTARLERRFPPEGERVAVEGGDIHVFRLGPAVAPDRLAVLLLHGAPGSAADLRPLGARLASTLPVLIADRPGSGWSTRPGGDADAGLGRQAGLIRHAVRVLGARRLIVVGHSFGGAVALRYALDHPDEVAGLVLVNPATHPRPGGLKWFQAAAELLLTGRLFSRLLAWTLATPLSLAVLDKATRRMFAPEPLPAGYLDLSALALAMTPGRFRDSMQDFKALRGELAAQAPRYPALAVPAVLVLGEADATVPPAFHGDILAREAPEIRLVRIAKAGHMLHHGHADCVAGEVARLAEAAAVSSAAGGGL